MAAANPLEEEITCNVCYDIYEDPHILIRCLHTYCLKCIKQLEKYGLINCPNCRNVTQIKDIKKDFKIQRFIDIHNERLSGSVVSRESEHKCGMCQRVSIPIINHCIDCEMFLCAKCSKVHQTNKALKSHKLISTSTLAEIIGSNLKESISKLEDQVKKIDAKLESASQSLADVEKAKTQQIADVRKYTMDGMKKNQDRLETLVNDAHQTLVNHLHESRTLLEQQKKDLLSKITVLKDLIKSQDIKTLLETAKTVSETIKEDISRIREIIERTNVNFKSPVTIKKNKNWDAKDSIEVSIDNIQYDSQQIGPLLETLYSELHTNTFTLTHTTDLSYIPDSLSLIDNQLWCPDSHGCLNVFDLNCQQVKEIKLDQIKDPMSVATCGNEHVIVACNNGHGLHLLYCSDFFHYRWYQSKITDGSFSSVVCYDGEMFALEHKTCKIIVLRRDGNTWSEVNSYQLQHSNGHWEDRLCVQRSGIYVSSVHNNCIYVFDNDGQFQLKRGEEGSERPGQFEYPILCDVDSDGNMLVTDCFSNVLQVCDSSGQWSVVKLPGKVEGATGVVVIDGEIWIASASSNKLQKYKKNHHENL